MRRRGFTLIELLVVIGVIAILAVLIIPAAGYVRERSKAQAAKSRIEALKVALAAYAGDFGNFPPSSLSALGAKTNGVNDGSKALLYALTTTRKAGPYIDVSEADLQNPDGDGAVGNPTGSMLEAKDRWSLVDPWGNPYVYVNLRDWKTGKSATYTCGEDAGGRTQVGPTKSAKTGQYHGFPDYQVWSFGPNGLNDGGSGDDVNSWD